MIVDIDIDIDIVVDVDVVDKVLDEVAVAVDVFDISSAVMYA
jgi:hypothetical protein